jgi:hypothetical protein
MHQPLHPPLAVHACITSHTQWLHLRVARPAHAAASFRMLPTVSCCVPAGCSLAYRHAHNLWTHANAVQSCGKAAGHGQLFWDPIISWWPSAPQPTQDPLTAVQPLRAAASLQQCSSSQFSSEESTGAAWVMIQRGRCHSLRLTILTS